MDSEEKQLTVSELTGLIRRCLETSFGDIVVEGELSNCRPSSMGHLYFTLKDEGASISCVMFKNRLHTLRFQMEDGMLVRVKGSLSVYPPRGSYQLVCREIELAGTGQILAMLEERKRALAAEGLFDQERKKPLPRFPRTVGVVSSPTGAAVRDILNVLGRRDAGARVIILPAPVQGADAAPVIARRIKQANQWHLADVLIVGRGGGSLEDLLPFSDEAVVRAVAGSKIPVVSAVGHEIDCALSDFAADLRAPTPSAAAELVSENREAALERVRELSAGIENVMRTRLERARLLIRPFSADRFEEKIMRVLQPALIRLDGAKEDILRNMSDRLSFARNRMEIAKTALETASPLSVLDRGYSVVIRDGVPVRGAREVKPGDHLVIRPREGIIHAVTESTETK